MSDTAFEFDVVVTVRKRVWASGFTDREVARDVMTGALKGGMGFGVFSKRDNSGHPIEVTMSNDFELIDPVN